MTEPDDNTLDNAGPVGRKLADDLAEKVINALDGFPAFGDNPNAQTAAIARICADNIYSYAEELGG